MKRNYAAKRRERLRRSQEWRRNGLFALISLIAHAVLVLLLPAMAAPAPVKTVLLVELEARPVPVIQHTLPTPVLPAADTAPALPAAGATPAHTTPKPQPAKQSAPAAAKPAQQPQAPQAQTAKPSTKPAPAQSAPSTPTADVKITPAQPAQPVAPKSEQKTPVENKPAEQQGKPNPQPEPKAEPKAAPSSGDKPAEKPASAPPVNMPKNGPPAAPPAKDPGPGTQPAPPTGPPGPESAAPAPPPGPSKEELGLLSVYGDAARKRVKSQARNPDAGGGGTVKFEFTVAKNGRLVDVKLVESSGYKLLDNDALEACEVSFNESHEIIPFPKGVNVEQWTFFMALKYPLW